jgi:hypothetical protein
MRHAISPNLWPHHELTDAWKPTGILPPTPLRDTRRTADTADRATAVGPTRANSSRSRQTDRSASALTALTGMAACAAWSGSRHATASDLADIDAFSHDRGSMILFEGHMQKYAQEGALHPCYRRPKPRWAQNVQVKVRFAHHGRGFRFFRLS